MEKSVIISIPGCRLLQDIPYANFWSKIKEMGSPIVEPHNDTHSRVTFLYKASSDIENVVLATYGLCSYDPRHDQLVKLPDTDIFYKSYFLSKQTRTIYCFSPNDPMVSLAECKLYDCEGLAKVTANWQADPLNSQVYSIPDWLVLGDKEKHFSLLELADAPAASSLIMKDEQVPAGNIYKHSISSNYIKSTRDIQVYIPNQTVPSSYQYPLLIFFDGDAYIEYMNTLNILDNLIYKKKINPVAAVFISNPPPNPVTRAVDLSCSENFANFITEELIPYLQKEYKISQDHQKHTAIGASLGGLFAVFLALTHPDAIGGAISQSGAFWWKPVDALEEGWLIREFINSTKQDLKFYLDVGLLETALTFENGASILTSNRHMRDVLRAKDYKVCYAEYAGGHDYICWQNTLPDALLNFYGKNNN